MGPTSIRSHLWAEYGNMTTGAFSSLNHRTHYGINYNNSWLKPPPHELYGMWLYKVIPGTTWRSFGSTLTRKMRSIVRPWIRMSRRVPISQKLWLWQRLITSDPLSLLLNRTNGGKCIVYWTLHRVIFWWCCCTDAPRRRSSISGIRDSQRLVAWNNNSMAISFFIHWEYRFDRLGGYLIMDRGSGCRLEMGIWTKSEQPIYSYFIYHSR